MLLLYSPIQGGGIIPMTVINVHTGQAMMNVTYEAGSIRDVEFIEQFNEHLMIKTKGQQLKIQDLISNEVRRVDTF
jgi:hypothetical protein